MATTDTRYIALRICLTVIEQGRSLSQSLNEGLAQFEDRRERAFAQNMVLGTLRWQLRLEAIRDQLLKKPLKAKDADINQLICLGLYQILYMETPEHAAVSETVQLTKRLKKPWAKALINGILRNFLRDQAAICTEIDKKPAYCYSHPQWFTKTMRQAYPDHWQSILTANNQPAPLTLRVNPLYQTRAEFISRLSCAGNDTDPHSYLPQGVLLKQSTDVSQLPSFDDGGFSVQDGAAQMAAHLLNPKPGECILDACAAPGGKTGHLLELSDNQAQVYALEKDPSRIDRLSENLHRLSLQATEVCQGDAADLSQLWPEIQFDKILLDAPCSATGIIRRHPDIKWHRTPEDIIALTELQSHILKSVWSRLKPGGLLLYATCSVLPQENRIQMKTFLETTDDAVEMPYQINQQPVDWGEAFGGPGLQILPGLADMDGFYYCLLRKKD